MPVQLTRGRALRAVLATAAIATAVAAPPANAGILVTQAGSCPAATYSQPFARWLDMASYRLLPGASFEGTLPGWTLTGGARVVSGNQPFGSGKASLYLPAGSSATSPAVCAGLESPTLRFFARNGGLIALSSLAVSARVETSLGAVLGVPMLPVTGLSGWGPTLPLPVVANLLPLLPGQQTPISFRFAPVGVGAKWWVDDIYLDPFRSR